MTGFSAAHDSGTGGFPSLGNFPLFPQICPDDGDVNSCSFRIGDRKVGYVPESIVASPGSFAITPKSNVSAVMTVAGKTAVYRFTFPPSAAASHPLVLLDLTDLYLPGLSTPAPAG